MKKYENKKKFDTEFYFLTSRSGGAGGQHVNKVNTKVELRFDVNSSLLLSNEEKELLCDNFANIISNKGILRIVSQTFRSQTRNKKDCIEKFYKLLEKAFSKKAVRKKTKPSKKWHKKRLEEKKRLSEKKMRRKLFFD